VPVFYRNKCGWSGYGLLLNFFFYFFLFIFLLVVFFFSTLYRERFSSTKLYGKIAFVLLVRIFSFECRTPATLPPFEFSRFFSGTVAENADTQKSISEELNTTLT
jgi:hypothetical protein